ncbi:MAG: hypothetical protein ACHRXM_15840 [Isosphaerales bacterium]
MRLNPRICSLSIAHLVGGILCCGLFAIMPPIPFKLGDLPIVTLLAILLSQAYLLGLWTAFSDASLWSRLLVLGMGAAYLEGLFGLVAGRNAMPLAAATTALATACVLLAARRWGSTLRSITEPPSRAAATSCQIKIRELMILTFVLALLFAGARGMRETVPSNNIIPMVVFSLCNVVLGLAAAWAALGLAQPIKRWPVVFLLSPALATLFWYGVRSPGLAIYWNINVCLLMQAAVTFGSLLVLRSCGFRLVL